MGRTRTPAKAAKKSVQKAVPHPAFTATFERVAKLEHNARNVRIHSDEQVAAIGRSILRFGFTNPVLADKDGIVAGHGRVLAALALYKAGHALRLPGGAKVPPGCVPVVDCTGWTKDERQAYVLADNHLSDMGSNDDEALRRELAAITDPDLLLDAGFNDDDLADLGLGGDELFHVPEVSEAEGRNTRTGGDGAKATKTQEGYAEFAVVLTVENKTKLMDALNRIKEKQKLKTNEDALLWLANKHGR